MKASFWLERWEKNQIGFHEDETNMHLAKWWPELSLPASTAVFAPLCGKSKDLIWLRAQGHKVLGVEISPVAVSDFFTENALSYTKSTTDKFEIWSTDGISIYCGDFFDLGAEDLQHIGAVYDRASLIALPPEMRGRYAEHSIKILPKTIQMLLITLEYNQAEMNGPPFSVKAPEVRQLYANQTDIQVLHSMEALDDNAHFRKRGLTALTETVYQLAVT